MSRPSSAPRNGGTPTAGERIRRAGGGGGLVAALAKVKSGPPAGQAAGKVAKVVNAATGAQARRTRAPETPRSGQVTKTPSVRETQETAVQEPKTPAVRETAEPPVLEAKQPPVREAPEPPVQDKKKPVPRKTQVRPVQETNESSVRKSPDLPAQETKESVVQQATTLEDTLQTEPTTVPSPKSDSGTGTLDTSNSPPEGADYGFLVTEGLLGIRLNSGAAAMSVSDVLDNSVALLKGVVVGDVLVQINSTRVAGISPKELTTLLRQRPVELWLCRASPKVDSKEVVPTAEISLYENNSRKSVDATTADARGTVAKESGKQSVSLMVPQPRFIKKPSNEGWNSAMPGTPHHPDKRGSYLTPSSSNSSCDSEAEIEVIKPQAERLADEKKCSTEVGSEMPKLAKDKQQVQHMLAEAMEDQDAAQLQRLIPQARQVGVGDSDVSAAQRLLEYLQKRDSVDDQSLPARRASVGGHPVPTDAEMVNMLRVQLAAEEQRRAQVEASLQEERERLKALAVELASHEVQRREADENWKVDQRRLEAGAETERKSLRTEMGECELAWEEERRRFIARAEEQTGRETELKAEHASSQAAMEFANLQAAALADAESQRREAEAQVKQLQDEIGAHAEWRRDEEACWARERRLLQAHVEDREEDMKMHKQSKEAYQEQAELLAAELAQQEKRWRKASAKWEEEKQLLEHGLSEAKPKAEGCQQSLSEEVVELRAQLDQSGFDAATLEHERMLHQQARIKDAKDLALARDELRDSSAQLARAEEQLQQQEEQQRIKEKELQILREELLHSAEGRNCTQQADGLAVASAADGAVDGITRVAALLQNAAAEKRLKTSIVDDAVQELHAIAELLVAQLSGRVPPDSPASAAIEAEGPLKSAIREPFDFGELGLHALSLEDLEFGDRLGAGAVGQVWKGSARVGGLTNTVAIKRFSEEAVKDFRLECKCLGRLVHPNIVELVGYVACTAEYYLVIELLAPPDWQSLDSKQRAMRDVFAGLSHCHSLNLVHLDIKLDNIMQDPQTGTLKLIDFSIGQDASSPFQGFFGSLPFAAPELCLPDPWDGPPADVFSVGVVFAFLLDVQALFKHLGWAVALNDETDAGRAAQVPQLHQSVIALAEDLVTTQGQVGELCRDLLETDPSRRPTAHQTQQHPWFAAG